MPVAVRLTPSRGGGVPARTAEWMLEVKLQTSLRGKTCTQEVQPLHLIQLIRRQAGAER